jgi:preprotein translocase subunit SecA
MFLTNLKEAYESEGRSLVTDFEKNITAIDEAKHTLRKMDELKQKAYS